MKFHIHLIYSFLIAGCSGYQYVASPPYVPLHTKRGQSDLNIYLSGIQAGYAFSNHLMCFATGYRRFNELGGGSGNPLKKDNTSRYRESKALEINIGAGYFNTTNRFNYSMLIGGGAGKMDYTNTREQHYNYDFAMNANTKNVYIQPNIGLIFNEHFELSIFTKVNFYKYSSISTTNTLGYYLQPEVPDDFFIDRDKVDLWILSSGVSFKGGWNFLKFHIQGAPTILLKHSVVREQPINLNVGISFNPSTLLHRNQK